MKRFDELVVVPECKGLGIGKSKLEFIGKTIQTRRLVATIREKIIFFAEGTAVTAKNLLNANARQPLTRKLIDISKILFTCRTKCALRLSIFCHKGLTHLRTNLKRVRPNGGPKPGHDVFRFIGKTGHGFFQHAFTKAPPAGMSSRNFRSRAVAKKHRQAISGHHRAYRTRHIAV